MPPRFGLGEILVGRELHVAAFSRECRDLDARPFGQRRVVGEILAAFAWRRGGARRAGPRTRTPAASAPTRSSARSTVAGDMPAGVDPLDRVGDLQRRDRGPGFAAGGDGAGNQLGRAERPRRVMHQHDVGRARLERLQPGSHRGLPRRAARHRGSSRKPLAAAS